MMEEDTLLKSLPILKDLGPHEVEEFRRILRPVQFPAGKTILREGENGETMYILAAGTVEISKNLVLRRSGENSKDRDKVLTKLTGGEDGLFGEVALFEEGPRTATAVALTDCRLFEIRRSDFMKLAEENPRLGYRISQAIAQLLCARLRKANADTIKLSTALSLALNKNF